VTETFRKGVVERVLTVNDDGFRLEGAGCLGVEARLEDGGWRLVRGEDRWLLTAEGCCLVLRDASGAERARWSASDGQACSGVSGSILTADGRLFLVGLRGGRQASVALSGWETDGPYWSATPAAGGWVLRRMPAGEELPDADEAIVLTFAAALAELRD